MKQVAVQYEIKITGSVQGVGFRYFVQKRATEFEITGWVKNMSDGSVRVMARGDESGMNAFVDHLKAGPSMARVADVSVNRMPETEQFDGFRVKY
jgi:acylphosphatase